MFGSAENTDDDENSLMTYSQAREIISSNDYFLPFRNMFLHEPLLKFVYSEKCRFSGPFDESRVIVDDANTESGGYLVNTSMPEDAFHPRHFTPFELKGLWLPLSHGTLFLSRSIHESSDLMRLNVDTKEQEILFLIHPSSEGLYQDLITQYSSTMITVSALSLSSLRTLLIAYPNNDGTYKPLMVKISLDRLSQDVSRILTTRECALSVANSKILRKKITARKDAGIAALAINIIEDDLAYVPNGLDAGMLLRTLPDCLDPMKVNQEGLYLLPLLSLYGMKNRDFLTQLVLANGSIATTFLTMILENLVNSFVELLYVESTSIEAHGQNLMLVLDQQNRFKGLTYRDMGGVNILFSQEEWQSLPANLQKKEWYYFDSHIKDAAKAFEDHIVRRGLFPLTKQLCKSPNLIQNDIQLLNWQKLHVKNGTLKNWTLKDLNQNTHETRLLATEFCRYGYVETLCAEFWINAMVEGNIISQEIGKSWSDKWNTRQSLPNEGDFLAPFTCDVHGFFYDTIVLTFNNHDVLLDKIQDLKNYGFAMINEQRPEQGNKVIILADELQYVIQELQMKKLDKQQAGENIQKLIKNNQPIMGEDRKWKDIIANILLACSIVGLVVMGVNYIYSGQFFLNTTRQQKLAEINKEATKSLDNISGPSISAR
jgi:hypothetical protein